MPLDVDDTIAWIERYCSISNPLARQTRRPTIPFTLSEGQRAAAHALAAMRLEPVISVCYKTRQVGFTTLCLAWNACLLVSHPGIATAIIGPEKVIRGPVKSKLEVILRSVAENLGDDWPGIEAKNKDPGEIILKNGSRVVLAEIGASSESAASTGIGETLGWVHATEVYAWKYGDEIMSSLLPAVELAGASLVMDSTPAFMPGQGEELLKHATAAYAGEPGYDFFFWEWWRQPGYRDPSPARNLTDEELRLMEAHGLDAFQIAWRRRKMGQKSFAKRFHWIYLEDAPKALSAPSDSYAFDADVMRGLASKKYPDPLTTQELWEIFPADLRRDWPSGDMMFSPKIGVDVGEGFVRVWRPPVPGMAYRIGVDPSKGLSHGDWTVSAVLDSYDRHCATIRTRVPPIRHSALLKRMALWYDRVSKSGGGVGCKVEIEMASTGGLIYLNLTTAPEPSKLLGERAWGCHFRFPTSQVIERAASAANRSSRTAAMQEWVNGGQEVLDKLIYLELTKIDPDTGRCRNSRVDHDDYHDAIGIAADGNARDRTSGGKPVKPEVTVATRVLESVSLRRR